MFIEPFYTWCIFYTCLSGYSTSVPRPTTTIIVDVQIQALCSSCLNGKALFKLNTKRKPDCFQLFI